MDPAAPAGRPPSFASEVFAVLLRSSGSRLRALGAVFAAAVATLAALSGPATASADTSSGLTNPKHFFWAPGQNPNPNTNPNQLTNDLIYHGGSAGPGAIGVEVKPLVFLVYWGPGWAAGFTTPDTNGTPYSSATLQNYVNGFFGSVGGSPWAGVQTQYCRSIPAGSTSCSGYKGAQYITNPAAQLGGTWTDPSAVPADIVTLGLAENLVDDPIADEAARAAAHFGYKPDATYVVLTPPGTVGTGQPVYCGYHTQTTRVDSLGNRHTLQYAFIPFLNMNWPGLGTGGCGMHFVNQSSDAYGHGIFDGYSIVTGHEYAEAVTDPDNFFSNQDGWNDAQGSENGDKCAWAPETANVTFGSQYYAVQALWSNQAYDAGKDPCAMSRT